MNWLFQLDTTNPVAHAVAVLALVCFAGMALGSLKVRCLGLGTAGVLFVANAPTVAYATVYPLTMLLRILCAQVPALVLFQ